MLHEFLQQAIFDLGSRSFTKVTVINPISTPGTESTHELDGTPQHPQSLTYQAGNAEVTITDKGTQGAIVDATVFLHPTNSQRSTKLQEDTTGIFIPPLDPTVAPEPTWILASHRNSRQEYKKRPPQIAALRRKLNI